MDEGYLVLIKANETLGETIQTSLITFILAKFNLAIISRENIIEEDDRKPCFLLLDEPDHYIKGSNRWRNMLTRYRKYRCSPVLMFHGWQQLTEQDRNLPKIIRKAGPHYVIFQTDLDNMLELQPVIEPEFKIKDIAKGMPKQHAIVKLKMYSSTGEAVPSFMAKAVPMPENRFKKYDNNDLYEKCSKELGLPKEEVLQDLYKYKSSTDDYVLPATMEELCDEEIKLSKPKCEDDKDPELEAKVKRRMIYEVGSFIEGQIERGEDPDIELIQHMEELLDEGGSDE